MLYPLTRCFVSAPCNTQRVGFSTSIIEKKMLRWNYVNKGLNVTDGYVYGGKGHGSCNFPRSLRSKKMVGDFYLLNEPYINETINNIKKYRALKMKFNFCIVTFKIGFSRITRNRPELPGSNSPDIRLSVMLLIWCLSLF